MADYLVVDSKTGQLDAYLNEGQALSTPEGWRWRPVGSIATGLGPGKHIRFADIDGDGFDDYIFLHPNGGTTIYRNVWDKEEKHLDKVWAPMPDADASGIGQRPEEISFHDINGDGKADYIWTRAHDGRAVVHLNQWPNKPVWGPQTEIAGGVGAAIAAWLNGCEKPGPEPERNVVVIYYVDALISGIEWQAPWEKAWWQAVDYKTMSAARQSPCNQKREAIPVYTEAQKVGLGVPDKPPSLVIVGNVNKFRACTYSLTGHGLGTVTCSNMSPDTKVGCVKAPQYGTNYACKNGETFIPVVICSWVGEPAKSSMPELPAAGFGNSSFPFKN
jgi:hypothetical protein